jgi:hypothetical protein
MMDLNLMVIVPRYLPSRVATLKETLAGTAIRVVAERRQGERRRGCQAAAAEQRHGDRRAAPRVVAYVYACPVVAVGTPPTGGTPVGSPVSGPSPSPRLEDTGRPIPPGRFE